MKPQLSEKVKGDFSGYEMGREHTYFLKAINML